MHLSPDAKWTATKKLVEAFFLTHLMAETVKEVLSDKIPIGPHIAVDEL